MGKERETFTISELALQLDISPSTIRFFEEKRLLSPKRTSGNQRLYTTHERGRLKLIIRGKHFGASLDEIAEMVGLADMEIKENEQIDRSLYYIDKKFQEVQHKKEEIVLFENDLLSLKEKLLSHRKELKKRKR